MLVNTFFEKKVDQLFDVAGRFSAALSEAGIEYRITGGFAAYIYVNAVDLLSARLTRDIDAEVNLDDIPAVIEATRKSGFRYERVNGIDKLVDAEMPGAHSEVHLLPVPALSPPVPHESGILIDICF
jgi:hypothetical protein